jgi:subtilase family serine protease
MAVSYRWYDSERKVIARTRRRSAPCHQFTALPNLTAALAGVQGTRDKGVLRYTVRVANLGEAAATAVPVRLTVDGAVVDTVTLASLRVDERRLLTFRGPECRTSVTAAVDPDGVLVESSENDNRQTLRCADLAAR